MRHRSVRRVPAHRLAEGSPLLDCDSDRTAELYSPTANTRRGPVTHSFGPTHSVRGDSPPPSAQDSRVHRTCGAIRTSRRQLRRPPCPSTCPSARHPPIDWPQQYSTGGIALPCPGLALCRLRAGPDSTRPGPARVVWCMPPAACDAACNGSASGRLVPCDRLEATADALLRDEDRHAPAVERQHRIPERAPPSGEWQRLCLRGNTACGGSAGGAAASAS